MELSDKEWKIIEPLLPELPSGIRGRPWRGNREVLDGILWILRTGAPWRDLPMMENHVKTTLFHGQNELFTQF